MMRVEGTILPVDRKQWSHLIDSRAEFRRPQPRQAINPFTRETMVIHPAVDTAEVMIDGVVMGQVSWSMTADTPLVNVTIERSALPLVLQWAAELGGVFREGT